MRVLLRELESNQLALLMVTCCFLIVLAIIGTIAAKLLGIDVNFFLGLAGVGGTNHAASSISQASQARSPNYTPQANTITPPTAPVASAVGTTTPSPPAVVPPPPPPPPPH